MDSKFGEKQFVLDDIKIAKDQTNAAVVALNELAARVDVFSKGKVKGDSTTEIDVARDGIRAVKESLQAALWTVDAISIAKM